MLIFFYVRVAAGLAHVLLGQPPALHLLGLYDFQPLLPVDVLLPELVRLAHDALLLEPPLDLVQLVLYPDLLVLFLLQVHVLPHLHLRLLKDLEQRDFGLFLIMCPAICGVGVVCKARLASGVLEPDRCTEGLLVG